MKKIAVMGECMVEFGSADQACQAQNTSHAPLYNQGFAGDVFNTGVYLKRCVGQGITVEFLSAIGVDHISDQFTELMQAEGISQDYLYRFDHLTMGLYMINLDSEGERSFTYWRDNSAAKQIIKCIHQDNQLKKFSELDALFFSGISIAILSPADLEIFWQFLAEIKQMGVQIIFDPNYRVALWKDEQTARLAFDQAFQLADVALPGVEDHMVLYGAASANDVANHLEGIGIKEIVIKNGPASILISENGERSIIDVMPAEKVIDTTSAGDAFNGGYLSAKAMGHSVKSAALFASDVAKCVIQHKGAIVEQSAFAEYIAQHPIKSQQCQQSQQSQKQ